MDLYTEAASVIEKFENKRGSVKSLVFSSNYKNVRQLYALVCESLKYQQVLTTVFQRCDSLQQEDTLREQIQLAVVLLYEHLVGKGLGRAGKIRSCIVKHKREIQEVCQALMEERGVASLADLLSSQCQALNKLAVPRYARVNLLKTTVEDTIAAFSAEGWRWRGALSLTTFHTAVESLGEDSFALDPLLWDLLVFPPGTDLHDHPLTLAGCIVLQDRHGVLPHWQAIGTALQPFTGEWFLMDALQPLLNPYAVPEVHAVASCFPAHVLGPPEGATVLDCCAAPGNKTSHAASLMKNSGRIVAFERDGKRMSLLQQQLKKMGVENTTTRHQDFLSVDPHDEQFADVQYILVDPSCSGSGIVSRMDHISTDSSSVKDSQRLHSLQRFQISILKHALQFPAAQRIVYSTCSVHEEENEAVVREVAWQVEGRFVVKHVFPQFCHRGKGCDQLSHSCLRMSPKKDLTNGFFVACFERVESRPENAGMDGACDVERGEEGNVEKGPKGKGRKQKRAMGETVSTVNGSGEDQLVQNGDQDQHEVSHSKRKKRKREKQPEEGGKDTDENRVQEPGIPENMQIDSSSCDHTLDYSTEGDVSMKKKKKKKRKTKKEAEDERELDTAFSSVVTTDISMDNKRKKKKESEDERRESDTAFSSVVTSDNSSMKKKRKKKKETEDQITEPDTAVSSVVTTDNTSIKKKRKKTQETEDQITEPDTAVSSVVTTDNTSIKKKRKKKKKT